MTQRETNHGKSAIEMIISIVIFVLAIGAGIYAGQQFGLWIGIGAGVVTFIIFASIVGMIVAKRSVITYEDQNREENSD